MVEMVGVFFSFLVLTTFSVYSQPVDGAGPARAEEAAVGADEAVPPPVARVAKPDPAHQKLVGEILKRMAGDDDTEVMKASIALLEIAQPGDVPMLIQALKQGLKEEAHITIIETLGVLREAEAAQALRFEVEHGKKRAQLAAIDALGRIGHDYAVPVLSKVLVMSPSLEVQKRAASALGRIGSRKSIRAMESARNPKHNTTTSALDWGLEVAKGEINESKYEIKKLVLGRKATALFRGTRYLYYVPSYRSKHGPKPRLLVCIHRADLEVDKLFKKCERFAKRQRMALLVPYFDNMRFPDYGTLNYRGDRADKRLLEIVNYLGEKGDLAVREIYLFGAEAGGNFVQRFAMAHPDRVARAVMNSVEYTFPDTNLFYPQGIKVHLRAPDVAIDPQRFIKSDVAVAVASKARDGEKFFEAYKEFAEDQGINSRLALRTAYVSSATPEALWTLTEEFLFGEN